MSWRVLHDISRAARISRRSGGSDQASAALPDPRRQGGDVRADADEAQVDVAVLVAAAADGDEGAWNELVDRYTPLLVRVIAGYRLRGAELDDVAQTVWLRLVEHLGSLREPRALPGWIVTTARHEALRAVRRQDRTRPEDLNDESWSGRLATTDHGDDELERAERHTALLEAFASLTTRQRQLLMLLAADPPVSYAEISRRTGMPVGSIGPTRARACEALRRVPAVQALLDRPAPERTRRRAT
jgi:RNA polymerase sigma factor (sigma-70 family)